MSPGRPLRLAALALIACVSILSAQCKGSLDDMSVDAGDRADAPGRRDAGAGDSSTADAWDEDASPDDAGPPVDPVLPGLDSWPYRAEGRTVPLRGNLYAYNPHRVLAHRYRGSGHTHAAPDHSGIPSSEQESRLRDLPGEHAHQFVWLTAHNFVAPDPGVDGIVHLFGVEVYADASSSGESPHIIVFLPDGSLADESAEPFGSYDYTMAEVVRRVVAAGGLPTLAHPTRYSPTIDDVVSLPDDLWGIEGVSAGTDIDGNLEFIDARLSAGKYTCISAGNDLHGGSDGLTAGNQLVSSDEADPTADEIFRQVRDCNFFACTVKSPTYPPIAFPEVTVADGVIRFRVGEAVDHIEMVGLDGRVLASRNGGRQLAYMPRGDEGYVRVSAERASGRARCLSQPVWLLSGE